MSYRILTIGSLLLLGACSHAPVLESIACPARPLLEPITEEQQLTMDSKVVGIVAQNQLKLKSYAKKLEERAGCEW